MLDFVLFHRIHIFKVYFCYYTDNVWYILNVEENKMLRFSQHSGKIFRISGFNSQNAADSSVFELQLKDFKDSTITRNYLGGKYWVIWSLFNFLYLKFWIIDIYCFVLFCFVHYILRREFYLKFCFIVFYFDYLLFIFFSLNYLHSSISFVLFCFQCEKMCNVLFLFVGIRF